jgi:hypothetical protein
MPPELLRRGLWGVPATPFRESTLDVVDDSLHRQIDHSTVAHMTFSALALVSFNHKMRPGR